MYLQPQNPVEDLWSQSAEPVAFEGQEWKGSLLCEAQQFWS